MAKDLGLELVGKTNRSLDRRLLVLLGLLLRTCGLRVASASTAGMVVSAVLAWSDSSLGNDVHILALRGGCAYVSDVASTSAARTVRAITVASNNASSNNLAVDILGIVRLEVACTPATVRDFGGHGY